MVARARFDSRSPVIAGIELWAMIAIGAAVLVGATLQGVVGLGLGLIVAPVTGLVAPQLLPGLALWLAMLLPLFTLTRDWRSADWRGLCWALAGGCMPATLHACRKPRSACGWCGVCRSGHCTSSSASSCWPRWP